MIPKKDNSQFNGGDGTKSVSKINASSKSSRHVSLMNSNTQKNGNNGGKKKKGKKKKKGSVIASQ